MPHSPAPEPAPAAAPPENLAVFAEGFFEGAGPALTTVLNRKTAVGVLGLTKVAPADLLAESPLPWVLVEVSYQRGIRGTHWLVLSRATDLTLGRALVGETDGDSVELLPSHQEAIRDCVNQMLVSAGPALMPLFTRSVSFTSATVHAVDDPDALPEELGRDAAPLWTVRARATGADAFTADLILTIGAELAREITSIGDVADEPEKPLEARPDEGMPPKIDLILDVTLPVAVELGRARMQIQDILRLAPGSVIELDKAAGDPVELFINDRPIAKGEVVVIDENFGVRITSIVTASERIKTLR
jgi:flagellar motor switch protein FliN/FliY